MFRGAWPERVTRVILLPLVLATHRSSPLPECRNAICWPFGAITAESAETPATRVARRWMSSQSISPAAPGVPGFWRLSTYGA
jgi:hypothetical protein